MTFFDLVQNDRGCDDRPEIPAEDARNILALWCKNDPDVKDLIEGAGAMAVCLYCDEWRDAYRAEWQQEEDEAARDYDPRD